MSDPVQAWPDYPAIDDPAMPRWHFGPPAQWMNDPNGVFWHDGWYHVFYQHNPGGEEWADMHWGHGRSRDLVNWEHLPLALLPLRESGEAHCYSGCTFLDGRGVPHILYTSVKAESGRPGTQVIATSTDSALIGWKQEAAAPVLDLATHGGPAFGGEWRDPYLFRTEGRTFLVLGARLGEEAVVALYENPDDHLRQWVYRGIIYRAPAAKTPFFECPNLFKLGKKWVLIVSPCREVEWCTGMLDLATYTFQVERRGRVDESDSFYAAQTMVDGAGRHLLFGWVQRFPKLRGWNGRVGAPRRIWVDDEAFLCAEPVAELAALRNTEKPFPAQTLSAAPVSLELPGDHSHEIDLTFERAPDACVQIEIAGVKIAIGPGDVCFGDKIAQATTPAPQKVQAGSPALLPSDRLRWLFDRSMIEIFVNDRAVYTRVVPFPSSPVAELSVTGGYARMLAARAWALRAAPATVFKR